MLAFGCTGAGIEYRGCRAAGTRRATAAAVVKGLACRARQGLKIGAEGAHRALRGAELVITDQHDPAVVPGECRHAVVPAGHAQAVLHQVADAGYDGERKSGRQIEDPLRVRTQGPERR